MFLNTQLSDFESSKFCDTGDMSKNLPGMRRLVLKMMIQMSKVLLICDCILYLKSATCILKGIFSLGIYIAITER